ncbi:hsp16-like protein [Schizosaccharomyces japonicus yFS275]|uniref:Hsp16-like protein n=1 Tax=Schizosaccharomyces japonicus (strain yFS275 / FY16936) TaxID=402676 RepID=B6K761_SCHJY|nr:hsp16-like protein [Schizosaccharomyces japonicus yFS275]EEB09365.1 hsp16-like protein [Schizosaccharomyces japonicus yFS275]
MSIQRFFGFPEVFDDFLNYAPIVQSRARDNGTLSPAIDVHEGRDTISVDVELPGVKKENVNVHYDNGKLTVSGEIVNERTSDEEQRHWSERRFGTFSRTISLPSKVDADQIEASFSNGLLTITLPKVEKVTKRQIEIK